MKKVLIILLIICSVGCSDKTEIIKKPKKESLTYQTFKKIDPKHYAAYFYDRNISKNDTSTIIIARDDNNYYYEYNSTDNRKTIYKDGIKYTINNDSYFKEETEPEDFSEGILPNDILKLKTQEYKTGKEKVYNSKYTFEEYRFNSYITTYYFKGKKLSYIKSASPTGTSLLKFDKFKKPSKKMFEIPEKYSEMNYWNMVKYL